ncbi:MAG: class I SAM-dependent methyltransferase [Desulfurococcaceae archaeon]
MEEYPDWRILIYELFVKEMQGIHLIRADSHDPKTLEIVRKILGDRGLDFLFIDGDHTYEGVKKDFEMYSPLVEKGGMIAFHDIVEHPPKTGCEVSFGMKLNMVIALLRLLMSGIKSGLA